MDSAPLPLPGRPADAHKHTFGTVVVYGGSTSMIGAPSFAAAGALRAGAGVVRLAVPAAIMQTCLALVPSAMGLELPAEAKDAGVGGHDPRAILAIGPGLGSTPARLALVDAALRSPHALVLDADGLVCLAALGQRSLPRAAPLVLTPHAGEFAKLAERWNLPRSGSTPTERVAVAAQLAARLGAVVVLKGAGTVISDGTTSWTNGTGNPALAIPGSGDVLTGVIAAFMAQGLTTMAAARLGAHIHGLAADIWAERHGPRGLMAMDLAGLLPQALARHAGIAG